LTAVFLYNTQRRGIRAIVYRPMIAVQSRSCGAEAPGSARGQARVGRHPAPAWPSTPVRVTPIPASAAKTPGLVDLARSCAPERMSLGCECPLCSSRRGVRLRKGTGVIKAVAFEAGLHWAAAVDRAMPDRARRRLRTWRGNRQLGLAPPSTSPDAHRCRTIRGRPGRRARSGAGASLRAVHRSLNVNALGTR
jgi:hypothetical protein